MQPPATLQNMVLLQPMDPWGRGVGIGPVFCNRGSGFAFGMQIHIGGKLSKILQFLIIKSLDLDGTDTFYIYVQHSVAEP